MQTRFSLKRGLRRRSTAAVPASSTALHSGRTGESQARRDLCLGGLCGREFFEPPFDACRLAVDTSPSAMRFPRARRITRRSDFQRVRRKGRSFRGRHLVLGVMADAELRSLKVGYITTRRLGNAVTRVQVRRRLRGVLQRLGANLKAGHWLVMVARHSAAHATSAELEHDWTRLARRAGILLASNNDSNGDGADRREEEAQP